ncbi:uncharacterized protein LOC143368161 isoform X2 [Andrena cerasifolii]|uniref:uncharacterized protein LOC143368161 isoform X2 n=1 Tax=Andrena cerasifolii TaxID=2819439 RepID=UPI004037903B
MSGSGFRGRGYGPRGARSNGPSNGFNSGPRFPHPNFNHSRPPHRLQGPDKWIDGPKFPPWQQNKGYGHRPQYRGNLQYRPNSRGRAANSRGLVRFSGPGRPPAPQFSAGFIRNQGPRVLLPQEDQVVEEDKCVLPPQTPLLGSEEERQQKITETADKLKQKLSSITEEDLTNFWEDDFSILPNIVSEEENIRNKGIPELRHEPPELDLTFTDFRDIGRVDCNNSRFDDIEDSANNDCVSIPFANEVTDRLLSTNDEITVVNESAEDCLIILDSVQDDVLDQPDVLLESDTCQQEAFHELLDPECNLESLHLQCDIVTESGISLNPDDVDGNLTVLNVDEDIIDSTYIQPIDDVVNENPPLDLIDIETAPISLPALNDQDVSQVDFTENPNLLPVEIQDINGDTIQDINLDVHQDDEVETDLHQAQDNLPTNVFQEEACQIPVDASDAPENNSLILPPLNEDNQSNIVGDTVSPTCSSYNEVHNLNNDTKLNNPPHFQPRGFNVPPRFAPRIPGPRCPGPRWGFQQNGNNAFFRGPQRLPFHGSRMPPPRHIVPFQPNNLVPVPFDPRAPPPFAHNVAAPSHDSQHHALVPFSSNDLPPSFDPTEPPPNIRPVSGTESSNRQDIVQTIPPLDTRKQTTNVPPNNMEIMQPPPTFDPRGPPPRISNVIVNANENLPEFNPQQPPPKIHKRDETLQPPPIFDPRLSSQERSKLLAPINASAAHMMPGFNLTPVTPNFAQPPPMSMPSHQAFIPNLPVTFQPVLPQATSGPVIVQEFALPPPPMSITNVPPPLPQVVSLEKDSNHGQGVNMDDDGLEDMQEAMEFAKQIMNMTEDLKNNQGASLESTEALIVPLEIPVPIEDTPCSSSVEDVSGNTAKKQKKKENKSKKIKQTLVCGPVLEKQEEFEAVDDEQNVQNRDRTSEDALLAGDQIRPKVVFNLNSKTKVIPKPEEWHRPAARVPETRETQPVTTQNSHKEKTHSKRHSSESRRNNVNPNKKQQREHHSKMSLTRSAEVPRPFMLEKSSDLSHHQEYTRDVEKLHSHSSAVHKSQKSRKEVKKAAAPTSESSWKNRVISRFLKMSKNDICNMVNNSSLRKFDIAMKHLVKERRSSLSLEMRNTEDEKMKEYDREEFMNQLNAMLDPGAVVGITDLPTEFIHHLSEVLQLDPMPFELESSERESAEINEVKSVDQTDISKTYTSEYLQEEIKAPSFPEYSECENVYIEQIEEEPVHNKEESLPFPINPELNLNISRENTTSSRKSLMNKSNPEAECMYKKQQPLFNEADLDDILLQVTERTKVPPVTILPRKKSIEIYKDSLVKQPVTEAFKCNAFPQIPTKTAADLDDIFSAGIARAKSLNKSVDSDNSRARKSSSEDRNTFRSEKYERWNRKEQEDPDSFRNLTKEEWEAKYGSTTGTQASIRKTSSNSAENLSRDSRNYHSQRYCSSDSPMRHLSMSPLLREPPAHNPERSMDHYNELEEPRRAERSGSSTDTTTTSTSDSDEETVAPNVTKLLKVIKEKEKIAKKKSLNETIRDEVAAEIEKKWKEKSKHKERKSRKRERRKRDKREKRKKEKKRRRKRNSHSDMSKSSEQSEGYRMLTEDEIKKEVVVKQEPLSTFEDSIPFHSGASNTYVPPTSSNKATELAPQVESQSPLLGRQQIPVDTSDKTPPQARNKPTIISMTIQPKTKAQLKQMPESSNLAQKQVTEKLSEVDNGGASSGTNTDGRRMKEHAEKSKGSQLEEDNNESTDIAMLMINALPQANVSTINSSPQTNVSTNNPLPQANVSINDFLPQISVSPSNSFSQTSPSVNNSSLPNTASVNNSLPQINLSANTSLPQINLSFNITEPPHTEVSSDNITANATSLASTPTNPDSEVNNSNQSTIQTVLTAGTSSTETKSSYKKIDIKAYKERALQRRLREEAKLKENSESSVSLPQESQPALPVHKTDNETGASPKGNEAKATTEMDLSTEQIKDPRLAKIKLVRISTWEDSNTEVKEPASLEKEHKCTDLVQSNKELPVFVQSKNAGELPGCKVKEKSTTRAIDSDSSSPKDPVKSKENKNDAKAFLQDKVVKRDEVGEKAELKVEMEEKKSKKLPGAVESNKFKNIRSEGSKELKLKKEKVVKSAEKKRKSLKSKSMATEKHSKHSHERTTEEAQKSLTANINSAIGTDIEKASSCNVPEFQLSESTKESSLELATCPENVAVEDSIDKEINKEQVDIHPTVEENHEKVVGDNEKAKILETQQITDQGIKDIVGYQQVIEQGRIEAEGDQTSFNFITEENSVKEIEKNISNSPEESTAPAESVPTEKSDKEEDIEKDMAPFNRTSQVPIEESVVEDTFVEDKFMEDKPVEEKLVEDKSAEDKFAEDKSVEDKFAEDKSVEDTPLSTVDLPQVKQEPYSLEEDIHLNKKENLEDSIADSTPTPHIEMDTEVVDKYNTNTETKENKKEEAELRSPDSVGSPFIGFVAESIEDEINQVSKLADVDTRNVDTEEGVTENCKQQLETCNNDELSIKAVGCDKDDKNFSMEMKETDEAVSACKLTEEQGSSNENDVDKTIPDSVNPLCTVEAGAELMETENKDTAKEPQVHNRDMEQNVSPVINLDSQDTFDEDGEPFIVLDEYIDDADGKSLEKLSAFDLDLEDCIARDADIFSSKHIEEEEGLVDNIQSSNFNAIDFKELSEVFDKDNITPAKEEETNYDAAMLPTELVAHTEKEKTNIISSEPNIEPSSEALQNSKSTDITPKDTAPEICTEASPTDVPFVEDVPQEPVSQASCIDIVETEQEQGSLPLQHSPETSETVRPETPTQPSVPIETTLGKSLDSLSPDAAPPPETKAELVEPNKEADNCEKGSEKNLDDSVGSKVILSPEAKISIDKHARSSSTEEKKKPHQHAEKRHRTASRSHHKRDDEALHKIKSKSKMKHKEHKKHSVSKKLVDEAVQSDTVKVKYPSTKEAIMARMIEIDVEIHKLTTEKMTLYQMLTNDVLPNDSDLPQNNTVHESKEVETVVVRPRTPSALMSQLIQNIEASPVTNQCAKTTPESVSLKDSAVNPAQSNKSKVSKHEHHAEKKANSTLTRSSDNDEAACHTGDAKSSSSRKRKRPKWAIKWKETPDSINDTSSEAVTEEKQTSDAVKSILKKASTKQKATEEACVQASTNEVKLPEESSETPPQINKEDSTRTDKTEAPSNEVNEKAIKLPEPQVPSHKPVKLKTPENIDENVSPKENESTIEALNDTDTASSMLKPPENRTSERSSIYSDDSTWDSLLQNSSIDDQKKPTTGLALLEETYRKELAKTRRVRTDSRKRRRKKMQNASQPVKILTPEEEELPLSALYSKKIHAKKKSQSPEDQQVEKSKDEQQLWKNVDEVINAVAENRTADLYVQRSERQSPSGDSQSNVPDVDRMTSANQEHVNDLESNSEQQPIEEEERTAVPPVCNEPSIDFKGTTSNDAKDDASNDAELTTPCPNTSQDLSDNEEQVPQDGVTNEPQSIEDLLGTSVNIDGSVLEPFAQEVAASNNAETSRALTPVESSEPCITESSICSVCNDQNILDIPKINVYSEKVEEEVADEKNKEPDLQEEAVNVEKSVSPDAIVSENFEKDQDNSNEPHSSKSVETTNEITICNSNENFHIETADVNEESLKDTLPKQQAQCEKDNADDNSEKFYDVLKEECLLRAKEDRGSQRRRESERSNKSSSEESSRNRASTSSLSENTSSLKSEEAGVKRTPKRKRGSSRTPLRRSSRYTEEITKRIKVEVDASVQSTEQEPREKNVQIQLTNVSPTLPSSGNEEAESTTNAKKNRSVQKTISRKRCMPPELDILSSHSLASNELLRDAKRCKQQTVPTIMNCQVRLVDSKHTILKPNVNPNELKKYGISTINPYVYPNSVQLDHLCFTSPVQSTPAKDLSCASAKRATPTTDASQNQTSRVVKKAEDATQSINDEINFAKIKRGPKSANINIPASDGEKCTDPDIEVMPVLTKEQVLANISEEYEKPDVEIVEEKTIVTKNQHHNDSGSTLTVIETKDDKEQPRTQYTVHKGPILDIKVFENSFLAASEDGRIYRYSQASNGILNIYKGHKAAVTCLYVFNTSGTDINKEWMFSGSLDGTLRCYNVTTGLQIRDTADVGSPIQCMDEAWGTIFIGTKSGHVSRYHVKSGAIKANSIQFSDKSVLALKATNEGPRRVLIVASRSQPITIRDAQSGLFLRTICGQKSHTVYSLMRDHNLIYCGTSSTSILVFDFTNGEQMMQYDAGVGIVCMRLFKQLLFAGCYDGNIYVFNTKDRRLVCSIPGPGNMLLSMEVIDNKIIAGSKDKRLQSWQMSGQVRALL